MKCLKTIHLRVVLVENPGACGRLQSQEAFTSQQINPLTRAGELWINSQLLVISQELDGVSKGDGMIKVSLGLTFCRVHLATKKRSPLMPFHDANSNARKCGFLLHNESNFLPRQI